jgi:hypothetical protein
MAKVLPFEATLLGRERSVDGLLGVGDGPVTGAACPDILTPETVALRFQRRRPMPCTRVYSMSRYSMLRRTRSEARLFLYRATIYCSSLGAAPVD